MGEGEQEELLQTRTPQRIFQQGHKVKEAIAAQPTDDAQDPAPLPKRRNHPQQPSEGQAVVPGVNEGVRTALRQHQAIQTHADALIHQQSITMPVINQVQKCRQGCCSR